MLTGGNRGRDHKKRNQYRFHGNRTSRVTGGVMCLIIIRVINMPKKVDFPLVFVLISFFFQRKI